MVYKFLQLLFYLFVTNQPYSVGITKVDMTGPVTQIGMMGFGDPSQTAAGILSRLYARIYLVKDESSIVCQILLEYATLFQSIKISVGKRIKEELPSSGLSHKNIVMAATHTHSSIGASSWHLLYNFTTFGFCPDCLKSIVDPIVQGIKDAQSNMKNDVKIYIAQSNLKGIQISRSPESQILNPAPELEEQDDNVDNSFQVMKFVDSKGAPFGMMSFQAIHAHTIEKDNHLINSDNKGQAAYLFENDQSKKYPGFIASFGNSNEGDISSNSEGGCCNWVYSNGKQTCPNETFKQIGLHKYRCTGEVGDCNGKEGDCIGKGKGVCPIDDLEYCRQDYMSAKQEGEVMYKFAKDLFEDEENLTQVTGKVEFQHIYSDLSANKDADISYSGCQKYPKWCETELGIQIDKDKKSFYKKDDKGVITQFSNRTCVPAVGYGFAGGTTDGVGTMVLDMVQGDLKGNPFVDFVTKFLTDPSEKQVSCQWPKKILLNLGNNLDVNKDQCGIDFLNVKKCSSWTEPIVPFQLIKIGNVIIPAVPSEWTTTMGRRLRRMYEDTFKDAFPGPKFYPISGLSNTQIDQVATFEEYTKQRQEGSSTLFGPMQELVFLEQMHKLALNMISNTESEDEIIPKDTSDSQPTSFVPGVGTDVVMPWEKLGEVLYDVQKSQKLGDRVIVKFLGGNLRNNHDKIKSQLQVQKLNKAGTWDDQRKDNDWDTQIEWTRSWTKRSEIRVDWKTEHDQDSGIQRIKVNGWANLGFIESDLKQYEGYSSEFKLE